MGRQRKLAIGPARVLPCMHCAAPLSTPLWSLWCVLPLLAGIVIAGGVRWSPTSWLYVAAGFCTMSLLHLRLVPLVRRMH